MPSKPNPEWIDDENPELTDDWFARTRPAREVLPPALYAALTDKSRAVQFVHVSDAEHAARLQADRQRARAQAGEKIHIRISPDVLAAFRATGRGWQTRMDAVLREAVAQGRIERKV